MINKEQLIRCFNAGATHYEAAADIQVLAAQGLQAYLTAISSQRILEIGCGTGLFSQKLIEHFANTEVLLTDISAAMLAMSRKRFADYPLVSVCCMDGEQLALQDTYDLIVSSMTLHWFNDLLPSMQTIMNQLPAKGRFIFSLLGDQSLPEWRRICDAENIACGAPLFPAVEKLSQHYPEIQFQTEQKTMHYENGHMFLNTLKQVGANASPTHYPRLNAGKLRALLRKLNQPMTVTYEIIYGYYQKS